MKTSTAIRQRIQRISCWWKNHRPYYDAYLAGWAAGSEISWQRNYDDAYNAGHSDGCQDGLFAANDCTPYCSTCNTQRESYVRGLDAGRVAGYLAACEHYDIKDAAIV